jgi:ferredoxin
VRRGSRSEDGPISLSDPIITLTLITVVLWLAVIGWKLQRKEQANGAGRGGARRDEDRDDYDDGWDKRPRRSERARRSPEKQRAPAKQRAPEKMRSPEKAPKTGRSSNQTRGVRAEVEINPGKCARFAFCEHEAPEVFKLNGDRIDYKTSVPADQIDAVAMAVKVCPARAIKLKVPGTKPYLPQPEIDDAGRRPVRR